MKKVFITGGAGFFGGLLLEYLLAHDFYCVSIDLQPHTLSHPNLITIQGDIQNKNLLIHLFKQHSFDVIFHCAAILAHSRNNKKFLWGTNVTATQYLADLAVQFDVPRIIFISSNCLWGHNFHRPVTENDAPQPIEIYGHSKLAAENILLAHQNETIITIVRCPTIIDAGRLGLLSILYEFIHEGRKIYVVGGGKNQYQFIYAHDLILALMSCLSLNDSEIFHIGSDHVKPLADVFQSVITLANTGARLSSLPKSLTIMMMKIAYHLRLSPLGPYHYKMIAEDFVFDTQKIKTMLNWQPTLTNEEMLWKGYQHYQSHIKTISQLKNVSAHKKPSSMGIIRLLKWVS